MLYLHAAACKYNNNGFIIAGKKGAGKTTLLHYFLAMNGDYIANDRTFIDLNKSTDELFMYGFPIPIRVGVGTFSTFKQYRDYYRDNAFFKPQRINVSDLFESTSPEDKFDITPFECMKIFNCDFCCTSNLNLILIPNIKLGDHEIEIRLSKKTEISNLFREICFSPTDESRHDEWVINRTISNETIQENVKHVEKLLKSHIPVLEVDFGSECHYSNVINSISAYLNEHTII